MKKSMKYTLFALAFLAAAVLAVFIGSRIGTSIYRARYFSELPTYTEAVPERETACIFCNQSASNPPCLINLNTGEIGEIRLYDADPQNPAEIDTSVTDYGTMHTFSVAGASCFSSPGSDYARIQIPTNKQFRYSADHASTHLCDNCMNILVQIQPNCNYLIADYYERDNGGVRFYGLEETIRGIQIRHYQIQIAEMDDKNLCLIMESSYFD